VSRESRIRNLELQLFGDREKGYYTWDEFRHVYAALYPERFAPGGPHYKNRPTTPIPSNLPQLIRDLGREVPQKYLAERAAEPQNASETSAAPDSEKSSPPSSTCCSPELTGEASNPSNSAAPRNNDKKDRDDVTAAESTAKRDTASRPSRYIKDPGEFLKAHRKMFGDGLWLTTE